MSVRRTSIETFRRIEAEGLLSQLRFEVYKVVVERGPMTEGECWAWHFEGKRQRCSITPRFSELEERGVIAVVGERKCGFTGNLAQVWESTDNLPIIPNKKPTPAEKERARCLKICEEEELACGDIFGRTIALKIHARIAGGQS